MEPLKIFRIGFDRDPSGDVGYFTPEDYTKIVGWCRSSACPWRSIVERTFPAKLSYSGGNLADFFSGVGLWIATRHVCSDLTSNFSGIEEREVEILPPKRGRVWDYPGEPVAELWFSKKIDWNPQESSLLLKERCDECGRAAYEVLGVEELPHEEMVGERWEIVGGRARKPGMGVMLSEATVGGSDFFSYGSNFHMCTERAKQYIDLRGWTNVAFLEYGEVLAPAI